MGASGGFPIDIILFGMIAAFLVLRLRSILGKRTGFERPSQTAQTRQPPTPTAVPPRDPLQQRPVPQRTIPEPISALGQTLTRMANIDPTFTPSLFLDGAQKAFQIIVRGFANGDRATLRPLLGPDTWHAFDLAISAREKDQHTQVTDIRGIHSLTIEAAELKGTVAQITVRIVSDQVNLTQSKSGVPVAGTDAVTEINDLWTFERDLSQSNPVWLLVAAHSA
jgi:predicted lipid-binding transport protein (Tim44 family)